MASVQFTDVQAHPTEFLDLTSVTLAEFQQLVPPFEAVFQAHMAAWRLDGQPRTARRFPVYQNCPLPTPEDRFAPGGPWAPVQHGAEQSQSVDACPPARVTGGAARPGNRWFNRDKLRWLSPGSVVRHRSGRVF